MSQYSPNKSNTINLSDVRRSKESIGSEDHVFQVMLKQLELERTVERVKVELSLKTDFNLIDAFRMFDPSGTGQASH